ncbi:MAG: hypothetical protein LBF15_02305 [Candidatus Peribacteria bacterium]|jgi:hypothetical protein|nr:hypothetical protein [Candidatus Peribacteria bacterium]
MSNPKFDFPSQNNVSEFEISIFKEGKEYDTLNTSDFSFSFDTTDDDITIIDNKLQYSFRSIDGSGSIVSETKDFT